MPGSIRIERVGVAALPRLAPLWEALFDHHVAIGAAGLAVIDREESWALRERHYRRLSAEHPWVSIHLGVQEGCPVGYALSYADEIDGRPAMVLETLSVLPEARGAGVGTRLMRAVDAEADAAGIGTAGVDVMGGNPRPRKLYLAEGYRPHSKSWLRSRRPGGGETVGGAAGSRAVVGASVGTAGTAGTSAGADAELRALAAELGFALEFSPGPDDTWVSSDRIAELVPAAAGTVTDPLRIGALLDGLADAGAWTARVEIPAAPAHEALRSALVALGFRLSTERLVRRQPMHRRRPV